MESKRPTLAGPRRVLTLGSRGKAHWVGCTIEDMCKGLGGQLWDHIAAQAMHSDNSKQRILADDNTFP